MTITRRYFEQLAQIEDDETAKWMRALETPERLDLAVRRLAEMSPVWNSMLRDTIAPTELQAGVRVERGALGGAGQSECSLAAGQFDQRSDGSDAKDGQRPADSDSGAAGFGSAAPPSSLDTDLYQAHRAHGSASNFPAPIAVPMLSTGATDSAELRLHNVQAYGLLPFPLTEADDPAHARGRRAHSDRKLPHRRGVSVYISSMTSPPLTKQNSCKARRAKIVCTLGPASRSRA